MNLFKSKNFKYGSVAVALTVAVIAIVVVANVLLSALSDHFGWYADISSAGLSSFSDKSLDRLDEIDGENNRLTLYFFADENTLAADVYGQYILSLTKQLENRYDFITVDYIEDLDKETFKLRSIFGQKKEYADLYKTMYENSEFVSGTMVIRNDTYELAADGQYVTDLTGNRIADYRIGVFSVSDMYSPSGQAFLGEYRLVGQIVNVCSLSPTAYFLTGHGEMSMEEDKTYGKAEYLVDLLGNAGFTVKKLNLKQANFAETIVYPTVAVIFAPQSDFTADELSRLSSFVEKGGKLLFFADGVYYKMDNLNAFLKTYGIEIVNAKFKSGSDASVSVDGFMFAAEGEKNHRVLTAIDDQTGKIVVSDCRVLRADAAKGAEVLLRAPASAALFGSEIEVTGREAVALYTKTETGGAVFATGSASLASSLTYEPAYTNRDFLLSVLLDMGAEKVPLNMEIKTLATDGLDLTRSQAILISVLLTVLPALLFAVVGTVVYFRRKRS